MSDKQHFKTAGDAVRYCEKQGLRISPNNEQLFDIANSLYESFSNGLAVGIQAFRQEPIFIDARADHSVFHDALTTASKSVNPAALHQAEEYLSKSFLTS